MADVERDALREGLFVDDLRRLQLDADPAPVQRMPSSRRHRGHPLGLRVYDDGLLEKPAP